MLLSRLHIENFRGIRRLEVDLGPTTILIGENNTGKSSVLDAIRMCVDEPVGPECCPFGPLDFHRWPGAPSDDPNAPPRPIRIRLEFAETRIGEWSDALRRRFEDVVLPLIDGRNLIRFQVEVVPDGPAARCAFLDRAERPIEEIDVEELAAALRATKRSFHLLGGQAIWAGIAGRTESGRAVSVFQQDQNDELRREFRELYASLVDPGSRSELLAEELGRAGTLLALTPEELAAADTSDRLVELLLGRLHSLAPGAGADVPLDRLGWGTQMLVLLLLLGALLNAAGPGERFSGTEAIVGIEDPEAHLHPRVVASLWRAISSLRAQKIVVTHSSEFLSAVPLEAVRCLRRRGRDVHSYRVDLSGMDAESRRKVTYHIVHRRGAVLFARAWLLVEGETEFWLIPELARLCGVDLDVEGVAVVEFAQSGLQPLIRTARSFGIDWHLLVDGDSAGTHYADVARRDGVLSDRDEHLTLLEEPDIEHCLWSSGYAEVYRRAARGATASTRPRPGEKPGSVIRQAIRNHSKPDLALAVLEAARAEGSPGVPEPIRRAITAVVELARRQAQVSVTLDPAAPDDPRDGDHS